MLSFNLPTPQNYPESGLLQWQANVEKKMGSAT